MPALERTWRRFIQVFAYTLFGLGAWVLALVFFPVLWILPFSAHEKTAVVQKAVHYFFRLFIWFLQTSRMMDFSFAGADKLQQTGGGVVIANHPTILDVVWLIAQMPQADCIVKKALWENFLTKGIVTSCGYLPNDDGPKLLEAAIERVRQGRKVIIFPEGTRSIPGELRAFNKGFAHVAVKAPCALWPVVITCHPPALMKGHGIFEVPSTRATLKAVAQVPIAAADYYESTDAAPLAVSKVTAGVRRYFEEKLAYGVPERS